MNVCVFMLQSISLAETEVLFRGQEGNEPKWKKAGIVCQTRFYSWILDRQGILSLQNGHWNENEWHLKLCEKSAWIWGRWK